MRGEVAALPAFVNVARTGGALASGKCEFECHREIAVRSRAERPLTAHSTLVGDMLVLTVCLVPAAGIEPATP